MRGTLCVIPHKDNLQPNSDNNYMDQVHVIV